MSSLVLALDQSDSGEFYCTLFDNCCSEYDN